MTRMPRRFAVLAAAAIAALGLAACGSSPSTTTTSSQTPKSGGTLHIVAASGPAHLDTVPSYYTTDYQLTHAYTRQLLNYPTLPYTSTSDPNWVTDVTPAPDIATEVPSVANGGISNGGMTYTFHIKQGVDWNTTPPRQVTSQDFLREFKAFFNPVSPVGNQVYYESTIAGLTAYANAETAYFANTKTHPPTAANIAGFQNTHTISGISTPDSSTISFTLSKPASDFLFMLAMPFTSARPVEYDSYVPNSLQLDTHTISDGPYQISSYVPGKSLTLVRNPAWKQSTDSLRHNYVAEMVDTLGVTSAATQLSDMQAGTEDVPSDTPINPASILSLQASKASNFHIWQWSSTFPYIVFNLRSPNAGAAANKLLVRQAVEHGLDKAAAIKAIGGPAVAQVLNTVIPQGNLGYVNSNMYADNSGQGDVATCKNDLTRAGYPHGLTLTYTYPNDSSNTRIFTAIQASLANCGITLAGKPEPGSSFYTDLGNSPENNKPGTWDMGQPGWIPDWFGNNGRAVIPALFQAQCVINTNNYGCYNNPTVNSLVTSAEAATTTAAAGNYWHQADVTIMSDAAIVPVMNQGFPQYASARVRGIASNGQTYPTALFSPNIGEPDVTSIWLSGS